MTKAIDASFAGLAFPRRSASAGRPDVPSDLRPGAFLSEIVTRLTQDGTFAYDGSVPHHVQLPPGPALGPEPLPAPRLGRDEVRVFEDDGPLAASHSR